MEQTEGTTGHIIKLWQAWAIVAGVCLLTIILGLFVGYRFFWYKSTAPTRVQVELSQARYRVEQNPNDPNAWVDLGYAYFEAGDMTKARESYQKALQIAPRNTWINYFVGLVEFEAGDLRKAEAAFGKVIQAYPDNPLAYYMLGRTYFESGRYDKALETLNTLIDKVDRTVADAFELRGQVYEKKGQKDKAIADYKQALRLDPARHSIASRLRSLGVPEKDIPTMPGAAIHSR